MGSAKQARSAPCPVGAEPLEARRLMAVITPAGPILVYEDFESPTLSGWVKDKPGAGTIDTASGAGVPSYHGAKVGQFSLPAGNQRAELYQYPPEPKGAERWYSFSTFISADYADDPYRDIVAQWHEEPDKDL
ncbi:MAG: Oligopeptide/dipeptide transporter, C-terminal region, partial [Phycisphaerales bacterium]|nr:Oligopeptide/dipeptide transporter, C-terminal region [Phycisphaerales bacterium]